MVDCYPLWWCGDEPRAMLVINNGEVEKKSEKESEKSVVNVYFEESKSENGS
jgi:hypothetical protein